MCIRFNIGGEFFDKMQIDGSYYVDKTEILYDLLSFCSFKVALFTRPRRFGKTLTMSMMENFFNINKDSKKLFEGLNIMKHPEICDKHMNQHPVIFVSFKGVEGLDFESAYRKFENIIADVCKNISNIVNNEDIDSDDKNIFYALKSQTATLEQLSTSLKLLTKILNIVYGKRVILLIDEYDVPIAKAYCKNGSNYYDKMLDLIRGVLDNALKTNPYLEFAVITGCLRISKESIFTGTNNFSNFSILDDMFTSYFGFTEDEVRDILANIGCVDKLPLVRKWYDGYTFGNHHMYCPWDVLNYASRLTSNKDAIPQNFWKNTSSNDILLKFIKRRDLDDLNYQFDNLLNGNAITVRLVSQLTYDVLTSSADNIWSILLMTGYVTLAKPLTNYETISVKLPNQEISSLFEETVVNNYSCIFEERKLKTLMQSLWNQDEVKANKCINRLIKDSISFHDYHENFYHAFIAGVFSGFGYRVKSNREASLGRADIVVIDEACDRVIIIETKRASSVNKMDAMCDEAIKQIIKNNYADEFIDDYNQVLCYGVSFYKKNAMVKLMT